MTARDPQREDPRALADDYASAHSEAEPPLLHALYRATHLELLYPHMVSGHVQGRLLKTLVQMSGARRVLELGTYSGYSALCMAEGMAEGGELHTIERSDEQAEWTRRWFGRTPLGDRITLHTGDALDVLPTLDGPFDLAFIDADKRHYTDYLHALLPLVRRGGWIVADNTLFGGHAPHDASLIRDASTREQTRGIQAFNDLVASRDDLAAVMLPLRDGLTIIRKK